MSRVQRGQDFVPKRRGDHYTIFVQNDPIESEEVITKLKELAQGLGEVITVVGETSVDEFG